MNQAAAVAAWITVMGGAIALIWVGARKASGVIAKVVRMADAFLGEPPSASNPKGTLGLVARQEETEKTVRQILEAQERQDQRLSVIEEQVKSNGPGSETLRHTVDRVAQAVVSDPTSEMKVAVTTNGG